LAPSRSLPGLARYRAGLRGLPTAPRRHRPSLAEEPESCGPSGLGSPTELSLLPLVELDLLSWDSSGVAFRNRDLRRSPVRAPITPPPTPKRASASRVFAAERPLPRTLPHASVAGSHPCNSFRPRGFAPPRRFPPLGGRGLVASRCRSWGSPRFREPDSRSSTWQARSWREDRHHPRDALHTPRRYSRLQPYHVTVAVAPVPLADDPARLAVPAPLPAPSRRAPHDRRRRLRGVSPPSSLDAARPFPVAWRPSFHGLCSPSRSFPPCAGTHASARGAADDENPKKTVRISDKLRSAPAASVR